MIKNLSLVACPFFLSVVVFINAGDLSIINSKSTHALWDLIWHDEADAKEIKALLEQGANPHDRQFEFGAIDEGWDMLTAAILQAHFTLIPALLQAGLDPNKSLFPPISFVASLVHGYEGSCCQWKKNQTIIHEDYCFFSRVQKKYQDKSGFKKAYINSLELLLAHKADVNSRMDGQTKTALAMARERGHDDLCALLLKHGAKD